MFINGICIQCCLHIPYNLVWSKCQDWEESSNETIDMSWNLKHCIHWMTLFILKKILIKKLLWRNNFWVCFMLILAKMDPKSVLRTLSGCPSPNDRKLKAQKVTYQRPFMSSNTFIKLITLCYQNCVSYT